MNTWSDRKWMFGSVVEQWAAHIKAYIQTEQDSSHLAPAFHLNQLISHHFCILNNYMYRVAPIFHCCIPAQPHIVYITFCNVHMCVSMEGMVCCMCFCVWNSASNYFLHMVTFVIMTCQTIQLVSKTRRSICSCCMSLLLLTIWDKLAKVVPRKYSQSNREIKGCIAMQLV